MRPEFILTLPFILVGIATGLFVEDQVLKSWIIGFCVPPLILFYLFRQQILIWWYSRNPPVLDTQMRGMLYHQFPYYTNLDKDEKIRFERRLFMFLLSKTFEKKELDTVPEDIKGLTAACAIQLTFGLDNYLMNEFPIIVYSAGSFFTLDIKQAHISEVYQEKDNSCAMFTVDKAVSGVLHPDKAYNITIHEMANILQLTQEVGDYEKWKTPEVMNKLAIVRGATYQNLLSYTGKPELNFFAICIEHFFYNPSKFMELLPDLFDYIKRRLNQDPLNVKNPVIGLKN